MALKWQNRHCGLERTGDTGSFPLGWGGGSYRRKHLSAFSNDFPKCKGALIKSIRKHKQYWQETRKKHLWVSRTKMISHQQCSHRIHESQTRSLESKGFIVSILQSTDPSKSDCCKKSTQTLAVNPVSLNSPENVVCQWHKVIKKKMSEEQKTVCASSRKTYIIYKTIFT